MSPATSPDPALGRLRLVAQGLITRPHRRPADAVTAAGAMQGQDLPGALASAVLRSGADVDAVLGDLTEGRLVRGYPMRGTVFLLAAEDVAWMTELCARPAVRAASARSHRLGLDERQIARARDIALEAMNGHPVPRQDLLDVWERSGLEPAGGRGYHLLFHLIAGGWACYGPWNGTEQDMVPAADWLPAGQTLEGRFNGDRTAATAELLRRYALFRGPVTLRDFTWWTKLGLGDARRALPLVADDLESGGGGEPLFWGPGLHEEARTLGRRASVPLLLPGFDEFFLGYQDRGFALAAEQQQRLVPGNNGVFKRAIVAGGVVKGIWSRGGRPGQRSLATEEFVSLSDTVRRRLDALFRAFPFITA